MSSDDGGYVHDPAAFRDEETDADPEVTADAETPGSDRPPQGETGRDDFGIHGWVVVAVLVVCLFVVPGVVLWRPPGLPWQVALLVFPLLPGFLLGGAAVWSALAGRKS